MIEYQILLSNFIMDAISYRFTFIACSDIDIAKYKYLVANCTYTDLTYFKLYSLTSFMRVGKKGILHLHVIDVCLGINIEM